MMSLSMTKERVEVSAGGGGRRDQGREVFGRVLLRFLIIEHAGYIGQLNGSTCELNGPHHKSPPLLSLACDQVSVGPDGAEFFGVRKKHILRGTKYSLPKPKVRGGRCGIRVWPGQAKHHAHPWG